MAWAYRTISRFTPWGGATGEVSGELSHELQNIRILRQIHVTILTPPMSILMNDEAVKREILAEKRIFFKTFTQFSDSMAGALGQVHRLHYEKRAAGISVL
jgi:hypothetical protein